MLKKINLKYSDFTIYPRGTEVEERTECWSRNGYVVHRLGERVTWHAVGDVRAFKTMDSARQQRVNLVYRADLQTCVHPHPERVFLLLVLRTSCEVCGQLVLDSVAQN
jgi:hypothetical protein